MKVFELSKTIQLLGIVLTLTCTTPYAIAANSVLDKLSGHYGAGHVCPRELIQREGVCKAWQDSNYISIKKISPDAARIEIARGILVQKKDTELQPYYCFIDAYAKLHGRKLIFYKDSDGNHVRGLHIVFTSRNFQVIDKAQAEHRPVYCGDYVTLDQFMIDRRQKLKSSK